MTSVGTVSSTVITLFFSSCLATLEVYEGPDPTDATSPFFISTLTQGSNTATPHVYYSKVVTSYLPSGKQSYFGNRTMNWIEFGQGNSDTTTVQITLKEGTFKSNSISLLPVSYHLSPKLTNNDKTVEFSVVGSYYHISLEYESNYGQDSFRNSMLIFVGELDPNVNKNDPNVLYFSPGEHTIDGSSSKNDILKFSGETIYISRGAWVYGKIDISGGSGTINIWGHGVLDGSHFDYEKRHNDSNDGASMIDHSGNGGNRPFNIIGTTCYNPSKFCVGCLTANTVVKGYRVLAWYANNDGMGLNKNSYMSDSFIRTSDDSIKSSCGGPETVERVVIWQSYNGAAFQAGWNNIGCTDCTYSNSDIIHAEWTCCGNNDGVFAMTQVMNGGPCTYNNITYSNIRIDTSVGRIFSYEIDQENGCTVKDIYLNNILSREELSYTDSNSKPSQFMGVESQNGKSTISDVIFNNVTINNKHIMSDSEWNMEYDGKQYISGVKYQ